MVLYLYFVQELSTVLKSMGYNPTIEEIRDMVDQVKTLFCQAKQKQF